MADVAHRIRLLVPASLPYLPKCRIDAGDGVPYDSLQEVRGVGGGRWRLQAGLDVHSTSRTSKVAACSPRLKPLGRPGLVRPST